MKEINPKVIDFLKSQQNPDGSWKGWRPSPFPSMYCLLILEILGEKPLYKNTYKWVQSLQTDKRGFAETTGQNSWAYSTRCGAEMHRVLELKPKHEKEFIKYVLAHQNKDGGFSDMKNINSNLLATCYWGLSALSLGFLNQTNPKLSDYLKKELNKCSNLMLIFQVLKLLNSMGVKLPEINKNMLRFDSFENIYYSSEILHTLGKSLPKSHIPELFTNPEKTYKCLRLMKMQNIPFEHKKMLDYIREQELPAGGFFNKNETSMLRAAECMLTLNILGEKPDYKSSGWVLRCQNQGFARSEGAKPTINMQVRAIRILKIENTKYDKKEVKQHLEDNIFPINPFNAFYGCLAYAELDIVPEKYKDIIEGIMRFHNMDGGFGSGESYMYATSRCVVAIGCIVDLLDTRYVDYIEKIRYKTIKWIKSCENKGGFGWMPGECSYMQPTFLALHALHVLGARPEYVKKHIEWIKNCQNEDGGFHGGDGGTPSGSVYTYYGVMGVEILLVWKGKIDEVDYLGL